jgi:hypothetical protein
MELTSERNQLSQTRVCGDCGELIGANATSCLFCDGTANLPAAEPVDDETLLPLPSLPAIVWKRAAVPPPVRSVMPTASFAVAEAAPAPSLVGALATLFRR